MLIDSGATFSNDRAYRYKLWRIWDIDKQKVLFIGLNPSVADERSNDPTIIRCIKRAKELGYGGILMGNLFSLVSTDPWKLYQDRFPVGGENDHYLQEMAKESGKIIACWGNDGELDQRDKFVRLITLKDCQLWCFGLTKSGQPKHPL